MGRLWTINREYVRFDPARHRIGNLFGGNGRRFLPYHLTVDAPYDGLLSELIRAAKENRWQALDLSPWYLTRLPDALWDLTELQILYLGRAGDEQREQEVCVIPNGIEKLRNLQALSLRGRRFSFEKDRPLDLPNLRYLDIYYCGFPQIPRALLIPSIEAVGFDCLEEELSPDFASLSELKEAYLGASRIATLPENIGQLQKLEELFLRDSSVASLPPSILAIDTLREIYLVDTPLAKSLPPEILKQSAREIIQYVLGHQSDAPKECFNESKMILVGQGHVGKTSLLKRLVDNKFSDDPSTEGIDISQWFFRWKGKDYRLNTWDFGGQEIYHATHQFFLTRRSLYLLVWDVLAEEESGGIEYWLRTIQSLADDSPILLVVNKCDAKIGRISRIVREEYAEKFPQIVDVFYVSCKDGIGIGKLRKKIKEVAVELPLMKQTWLTSWLKVRRRIEQEAERKNHISYLQYLAFCKECGIADENEAVSLIKYLHDLGIVLYYHGDPLLSDLVILSSEWGTDAVYKVLDEQERTLKGRNGVLRRGDLPAIWKDKTVYPERYHPHLLRLMEKFQLAFQIDPDTWLVAELLSNQPIEPEPDFNQRSRLSFRYEYDFLPAGVMTRFIVSANRYLVTKDGVKQCWRKGAYLQYESAYALVRLYDSISARYIQIDVNGSSLRDKRELLSRIRGKLDEINSRFSKIEITQKIPCCCSENCQNLYDYKALLEAEDRRIPEIQCQKSWKNVPLSRLLDGVENDRSRDPVVINNFYIQSQSVHFPSDYANGSRQIPFEQPTPEIPKAAKDDVNRQLVAWAMSSELYRAAFGDAETDDRLERALCGDETDWRTQSYDLMKKLWRKHPEWGLAPNYEQLSEFEHAGKFYQKYRDHLAHMFKVYLLGLYLYEKSPTISAAFADKGFDRAKFLAVWSIAALYHDVGYVLDTEDKALDGATTGKVCEELIGILSHPLSQLYPDEFKEVFEEHLQDEKDCHTCRHLSWAGLRKHLDKLSGRGSTVSLCVSHQKTPNPIKAYYDMVASPNATRAYFDHGISSAMILLFMQDELAKYTKKLSGKTDSDDVGEAFQNCRSRITELSVALDAMSEYAKEAAFALALHNITPKHNDDFKRNLQDADITIDYFRLALEKEPFAYLLRVCDELQCWDRPYLATPIGKAHYLKGDSVHLTEKNGCPALCVENAAETEKIKSALQELVEPPVETWLDENSVAEDMKRGR